MESKHFFIFRHGETDYNKQKKMQGCGIDAPLNETGIRQAFEMADRLKDHGVELVCCSPLLRARQMAQIVSDWHRIPMKVISELREGCMGQAEGMYNKDIREKFADIWATWYKPNVDMDKAFPGGETKQQMQDRMLAAFAQMLVLRQSRIAVASHGGVIRCLLMKYGRPDEPMPNGSLFHLVYEGGEWMYLGKL